MANISIIQHMVNVLDRYAAGTLGAKEVEMFLDQYAQALEGIGANALSSIRQGAAELVKADTTAGQSAATALEHLRAQVRSLLGEAADPQITLGHCGSQQ